jgi:hypothetical protein
MPGLCQDSATAFRGGLRPVLTRPQGLGLVSIPLSGECQKGECSATGQTKCLADFQTQSNGQRPCGFLLIKAVAF